MRTGGNFGAFPAMQVAQNPLTTTLHRRLRTFWFCTALAVSCVAALATSLFAQGNVGIGTTTPNASAILDLTAVTQGFLVPRMSTTQKLGISNPAKGLLVFDNNF